MWEALNRTDADSLYVAAKMRAVTAAVIRSADQSAAADAEVAAEVAAEADRAMAWLQQAAAAGFRNASQLKREPDLEALRNREDFQMLMAELEGAQDVK